MFSCASVDHIFTGTDSSMKLRRRSVSRLGAATDGSGGAASALDLPRSFLRPLTNGFSRLSKTLRSARWRAVRNLPDRATGIVGHVQGAVGRLSDTGWPPGSGSRAPGTRGWIKSVREGRERSDRTVEAKRRKDDAEACLWQRCAVP